MVDGLQPLGVESVHTVLIGKRVNVTDTRALTCLCPPTTKAIWESRCGDLHESRGLIKPRRRRELNEAPGQRALTCKHATYTHGMWRDGVLDKGTAKEKNVWGRGFCIGWQSRADMKNWGKSSEHLATVRAKRWRERILLPLLLWWNVNGRKEVSPFGVWETVIVRGCVCVSVCVLGWKGQTRCSGLLEPCLKCLKWGWRLKLFYQTCCKNKWPVSAELIKSPSFWLSCADTRTNLPQSAQFKFHSVQIELRTAAV